MTKQLLEVVVIFRDSPNLQPMYNCMHLLVTTDGQLAEQSAMSVLHFSGILMSHMSQLNTLLRSGFQCAC